MFERLRRHETNAGGTAIADRPTDTTERTDGVERRQTIESRPADTRERLSAVRARQREQYGGINWGAAFFGWLVAIGLGALLVGLLAAAGAAVGITGAEADAESIGVGGAIALLAALAIAYYCGGYVAGRMSRFDGARQGVGAWLIGLIVTVVLAVAGALLGAEYNVLEQLDLPALPVGDQEFATGGVIALAAVIVGTFLAAVAGGKAGEHYHRKVDRAGFTD